MFALMRRLALSLIDPRPSDSRLSDLESLWTLESGLFALTGAGTLLEWARWSDGFADTGCESCVDAGSIGGKEGNSRRRLHTSTPSLPPLIEQWGKNRRCVLDRRYGTA